jgi:MFS family permease
VARFVLVLNSGSWISISFFIVLEPLFVDQVLQMGPAVLGLLQTAFGVGAIVGAALAARAERRVTPMLVALTIGICGTGMILYTVTSSVVVAAAGVAWWGVGLGLWAPFARTMIHRGVPVTHHGRVNGVMSSLQSGLEVVPVLAAGQLAGIIGIQATLVGAGAGSLVLAAWGCVMAPTISRTAVSHVTSEDERVASPPRAEPPPEDGVASVPDAFTA